MPALLRCCAAAAVCVLPGDHQPQPGHPLNSRHPTRGAATLGSHYTGSQQPTAAGCVSPRHDKHARRLPTDQP